MTAALSTGLERLSSVARGAAAPWLAIVGIGEDGRAGLSAAAVRALDEAALVVGGARHLALAAPLRPAASTLVWASPMTESYAEIEGWRGGARGNVCVLATGDPFHYGVGADLAKLFPPGEWVRFPQASAFSLAAARLGWSLPDCALVSVHGRALERVVPHLQPRAKLIVLSSNGVTPAKLAALLAGRGFGASRLTVLEAMGGPRERLSRHLAADFPDETFASLNTVAIEVAAASDARIVPLAAGLNDGWFENDGQLTKAEIRAITLASLAPRAAEILWDVGAGAGSVGIEWCLRHPVNRAVAVEERADRAERVSLNARALGVNERVEVVVGRAPQALSDIALPDAIFIGGGASEPGLVEAAWGALRSGGRLVVNAVTLETETLLAALRLRHGGELRRIALSRLEPVGTLHGWRPAMPVTQWAAVKP